MVLRNDKLKNMKTTINILTTIVLCIIMTACSDNDTPTPPQPHTDNVEMHYFDGMIELADAQKQKPIYRIARPVVTPGLYGYTIPMPAIVGRNSFTINIGDGLFIEKEGVRYVEKGQNVTADIPEEGTTTYNSALSITRISDKSIRIDFDSEEQVKLSLCKIMVYACPSLVKSFTRETELEAWQEFDGTSIISTHSDIPFEIYPGCFTDSYRPIISYHMYVF